MTLPYLYCGPTLSKEKDIPKERIKAIKEELCKLKDVYNDNDQENYHGDSKRTEIECKRLGTICFSEEANIV